MREKRFAEKPLQIRITGGTEHKLKNLSQRTSVDVCTLARLALNSGLIALAKNLPPTPPVEEVSND